MSRIIINAGANQTVNVRGNGNSEEELKEQARQLIPTLNYGESDDYHFTFVDADESEDGEATLTAERQLVAGSKGADGLPVYLQVSGIPGFTGSGQPVASVEAAKTQFETVASTLGVDIQDFTSTSAVETVNGANALVVSYDRTNITAGSKGARL